MFSAHHFEKSPSVSGVRKENRVHYANKKRRKVPEQEGQSHGISTHNSYLIPEKSSGQLVSLKNKFGENESNSNSSSYAGQLMPNEVADPCDSWPPHDPPCRDPPDRDIDALQQAIGKLLDIADRIPFIGVESTDSKVGDFITQSLLSICRWWWCHARVMHTF